MEKLFPKDPVWRIIRVLDHYPNGTSGRELAKDSELSHPTVHTELKRLMDTGLIQQKKKGSSYIYSIDRGHDLYKKVFAPILNWK